MTQVDHAFQRLREVNPAPDPSSLREGDLDAARFLTSTQEMEAAHVTETEGPQPPARRRGLVFALAAFAVVIVAGTGLWVLALGGGDTDAVTTPESLVDAFIAAWEEEDVEGAVALFTDGGEFDPGTGSGFPVATGSEEMRALFAEAMPEFRMAEAYDLEREHELVKFNTRLMARDGSDEECQRNELIADNGKIVSWVVTVLSTFPCP